MIAEIIPALRTPRGIESFMYNIPDDCTVQRGTCVWIPFRRQILLGVILKIHQHISFPLPHSLKNIHEVLEQKLWYTESQMAFLEWFSLYYYVSRPHAFATIQFLLPRRITHKKSPSHDEQLPSPTTHSLSSMSRCVFFTDRHDIIAWYATQLVAYSGPIVIIVPERHDISILAHTLQRLLPLPWNIIKLLRVPGAHVAYSILSSFRAQERVCLIGTKKALFFAPWGAHLVIIDQEEERSHKQYDMNPRYHTRTIALQLPTFFPSMNIALGGVAPSLVAATYAREHINLRRPWHDEHIRIVNMEDEKRRGNYSWFSEVVRERIERHNRTLLFLNRTGKGAIALCRDCSTLNSLNTQYCRACNGTNLQIRNKGISQIHHDAHALFPQKNIVICDATHHTLPPLHKPSIVIATEEIFRLAPKLPFDHIVLLSVDHLLVFPHWQAHERVFQLLLKFFVTQKPIIIQTYAPHHSVIAFAKMNAYEKFHESEIPLRRTLHVPPFGEIIRTRTPEGEETLLSAIPQYTKIPPNVFIDRD